MSSNPHFHYIDPFANFCIAHSALIHLMNAQLVADDVEVQRSQRGLRIHLSAIQGYSKCKKIMPKKTYFPFRSFFKPIDYYIFLLKKLIMNTFFFRC